MTEPDWREYWERKFGNASSDYEADRGTRQRSEEIERLAREELVEFVRPKASDTLFDAGCGSGANIVLFHNKVDKVIAIDFAASAVERARARITAAGIPNVVISQGDISDSSIAKASVDIILCMSVFHYLPDEQIRACLRSFKFILRPGGTLVLHVKNLSSLYIGTLVTAKKILRRLGRKRVVTEYFRPFSWYVDELQSAGFEIEDYNSFNFLILEGMPRKLIEFLQKQELVHRMRFPFNQDLCRRHGADLKIRAYLPSNLKIG